MQDDNVSKAKVLSLQVRFQPLSEQGNFSSGKEIINNTWF
jgi:hypothetical protein